MGIRAAWMATAALAAACGGKAREAEPAARTPAAALPPAVALVAGGASEAEACSESRCNPDYEPDGASGPTRLAAAAPPFAAARVAQGTGGENHLLVATAPGVWWRLEENLDVASHSTTSRFSAFEVVDGTLLVAWTASGETCTSYALVCGVGAGGVPACVGPLTVGEGCGAVGAPGAWRDEVSLRPGGMLVIAPAPGGRPGPLAGEHRVAFPADARADAAPIATPAGPCGGYSEAAAEACRQKPGDCRLGPPIWCSGVAPSPEAEANLRASACACTCAAERESCSRMPSMPPPQ